MNYDQAKAIAAEYAPELLVDDPPTAGPVTALVVRKSPSGMPFSIHLPEVRPENYPPIEARDAVPEQPAVPPTDDHPGMPAIPAQPAIAARTTAGQMAEAERTMLIHALDSAKKIL